MGIYLNSGYLDFGWLYNRPVNWSLITGGRGTGKTYGALSYVVQHDIPFIYLRRTQSQADLVGREEFSPFKAINADLNIDIGVQPVTKYNSAFYRMELNADGKRVPAGSPIGYSAALSTFANIRGFDASNIQIIIYDEFIPERHERSIKHEFEALANAYETINRNRELKSDSPVRLFGLSNSNDLACDIFIGLGVVGRLERMINKQEYLWEDKQRGLGIYLLNNSPISDAKRDTALYRLTDQSAFVEMALDNEFSASKTTAKIRSLPLKELQPITAFGELCIYRIKDGGYYASLHRSGSAVRYLDTAADKTRFKRAYYWIYLQYLDGRVVCESVLAESLLIKAFK